MLSCRKARWLPCATSSPSAGRSGALAAHLPGAAGGIPPFVPPPHDPVDAHVRTPRELALLGTMPDQRLAARLGVAKGTVRMPALAGQRAGAVRDGARPRGRPTAGAQRRGGGGAAARGWGAAAEADPRDRLERPCERPSASPPDTTPDLLRTTAYNDILLERNPHSADRPQPRNLALRAPRRSRCV